ncbi:MAG TPA: nuclear transport factor 2 family protein [Pyrinomonadaceae bacterium]
MATPHFDAAAVRQARPAVPLAEIRARRSWPLLLIALSVLAGLTGGVIGGILSTGYFRRDAARPAAQEVSANPATTTNADEAINDAAIAAPSLSEPSRIAETATTEPASISDTTKADTTKATPALGVEQPLNDERAQRGADENSRVASPQATHRELRAALNEWVAATNARNLGKQLSFYRPTMNAFYRRRNVSVAEVGADRARVFERAHSINIQAEAPSIRLEPDGQTATMLFRKRYVIAGGGEDRSGEVLQELRWQRINGRWRIISERDVKVVQ